MKILFICASLEPGKDGVGDYTRRLAAQLVRQGHSSTAISLNDKHISFKLNEVQHDEGTDLPVLRLPGHLNIMERLNQAKKYIDDFDADWLSLQFVIYGYHPKGLPLGFSKQLPFLGTGRRWHVMFHEIWQGESQSESLKNRVLGFVQKNIVKKLIHSIKPQCCSTSNDFYRGVLHRNNIPATLIPVFSNIPVGNEVGKQLFNKLPLDIMNNRSNYIIGGFFGAVHYNDHLTAGFNKLQQLVKNSGKKLVLTHLGMAEEISNLWSYIAFAENDYIYAFGQQPEQHIADYLCQIDVGLSTNPKILFEKSGSIAAMLNNKLPVILLRNSFEPDNRKISYIKDITEIKNIDDFITQKKDFDNEYGVSYAAAKYTELLNAK